MDYFERMRRRIDRAEIGLPEKLGDKKFVRPFADLIGVRTPKLLFEGSLPDLMRFNFPDEFVVKPRYASTSKGVFLLAKTTDCFVNLVSQRTTSLTDIELAYQNLASEYFTDPGQGEYLVEELLTDSDGNAPPSDIRAYMFQGVCGLILIEDHHGPITRASYFNGDFSPMDDIEHRYGVAPKASHLEEITSRCKPDQADELLAVAKRVSTAVPSAFCRVDLYLANNQVYLGEITLFPGTFYYGNRKTMSPSEAERLGQLWAEAETKLAGSVLRNDPASFE